MAYLTTADGGQVYFEHYSSPDQKGPTLVLVHGWGMSVRCWDPVLPALTEAGLNVVSLDHRGCGQSDKDFADLSIGAIAGDVVQLVEHLGLGQVVLNGWSLGGAVVVEAATRLGDRCAGLVLTGGATPVYTQKADFPHGGTDEDVAGTLEAYRTNRVDFLQGLSQIVCAKDVGANVENWFYQIFLGAAPGAAVTLGELAGLDQREQLVALDMPVLSVFGSEDGFVAPPICRWVGENHASAQAVELEGVGHAPFIEAREDYLSAVISFMEARA